MKYTVLFMALTGFFLTAAAQHSGALDPEFGNEGIGTEDRSFFESLTAVAVQSDGKIVAAGFRDDHYYSRLVLMRFHTDGSPDTGFSDDGIFETAVKSNINIPTSLILQPDGKIVVAGYTAADENLEKAEDIFLLRLLPDGHPDPGFGAGGATIVNLGENERPSAVRLAPDGKILVAGGKYLNAKSSFFLCRFLANGNLDTGFGASQTGANTYIFSATWNYCYDMEMLPDGKIVLAGEGTQNGYKAFGVMRLQKDGAFDPSFGVGGKALYGLSATNASPTAMELRPDGKILIGGTFNFNGNTVFGLMQLTSEGALDSSFGDGGKVSTAVGGGGYAVVNDMVIHTDGSFLAAGSVKRTKIFYDIALVKYSASGAIDPDFGEQGIIFTDYTGHHEGLSDIAVQSDGKLVAVGSGVDIDNTATNFFLARYFFDGSVGNEDVFQILAFSSAFPNPARAGSTVQLSYGLNAAHSVIVELYSVSGALLTKVSSEQKSEGRHFDEITLPHGLAPGLYLLGIRTGGNQAFVKINIF